MRSAETPALCIAIAIAITSLTTGCGSGSGSSRSADAQLAPGISLPQFAGGNVLALTVDGSNCSAGSYTNKPCVSVTLCPADADPSTLPNGSCQTINDILLDTGSYGLRVFKSVLSPALASSLAPVTDAQGKPVGDCANFMDGSADWGPVEQAGVVLGGEPAVSAPIQVIDASFGTPPSYCANPDQGPSDAGFNGILGVGVFAHDCGTNCVSNASLGYYYSCDSSGCAGTTLPLSRQITNPVSLLPQDNNGVIIELPEVPPGGADYAEGYVILGIGTQDDNQPSGVKAYAADPFYGEFTTVFDGQSYAESFLDTGSDALYFNLPGKQSSQIPVCSGGGSSQSGWYCPDTTEEFSAIDETYMGDNPSPVSFQVGNANQLAASPNNVFSELAGFMAPSTGSGTFDWGLPFHYGRKVYAGIEGRTSGLGKGPYWAF